MADYIEDFTTELSNWCFEKGLGDVEFFIGYDWAYYATTCEVQIPIIETEDDTIRQLFWDSVLTAGLRQDVEYPYAAISCLHEIGHHNTLPYFTEEEKSLYYATVDQYNAIVKQANNKDLEAINLEYYQLPVEKAATEWAVEFSNENPNLVWELNTIMKNAFDKIRNDPDIMEPLVRRFFI